MKSVVTDTHKLCSGCSEMKRLSEFGPNARLAGGVNNRCRPCDSARQTAWQRKNRDKVTARYRDPEVRERRNARDRTKRQSDDAYREEYNARSRVANARRRVPGATTREVAEREGWRCYLCGAHVALEDAEVDHIVPISRGGPHILENLAISHAACNARKYTFAVADLDWVVPSAHVREQAALVAVATEMPPASRRDWRWWSEDEDERLAAVWITDTSWPEILRHVGRSYPAIRRRVRVLGLTSAYRHSGARALEVSDD